MVTLYAQLCKLKFNSAQLLLQRWEAISWDKGMDKWQVDRHWPWTSNCTVSSCLSKCSLTNLLRSSHASSLSSRTGFILQISMNRVRGWSVFQTFTFIGSTSTIFPFLRFTKHCFQCFLLWSLWLQQSSALLKLSRTNLRNVLN